ncbi:MAG TPA: AAA family ATPase [Alcanivoracaceae bacterium]|nr:AAA family ATPase [Alcanivoracaceae bacterium]
MKTVAASLASLNNILIGKEEVVKRAVACLLAGGHLLIEDLPGMGKTTLAHALARVFGLSFQRIQFTSDMLPADIVGVSVFNAESRDFEFREGPVFTQVLLADEINRAAPKTQSALLEAMEEQQVTVDRHTHPLPRPFFVIATQNPMEQGGTFPLPESQLDRFLMAINIGYPHAQAEKALLASGGRHEQEQTIEAVFTEASLQNLMQQVRAVKASEVLIDYVQRLLHFTRHSSYFTYGLSPRAGLGLLQAARAWAFLEGRDYVVPEDVQAVLGAVVTHRLVRSNTADGETAHLILSSVPVVP